MLTVKCPLEKKNETQQYRLLAYLLSEKQLQRNNPFPPKKPPVSEIKGYIMKILLTISFLFN